MTEQRFETLLQEALSPAIADAEITIRHKETSVFMKHTTKRKMMIAVLAACLMLGTTCFAASKIAGYRSGMNSKEIGSFNNLPAVTKNAGFETLPLPETFENGYAYTDGRCFDTCPMDENGNTLSTFKEISATYKKGDTELHLFLHEVIPGASAEEDRTPVEVTMIDGIQVSTSTYQYRFVPTDYELTPEDEAFAATPGCYISVGSDEVEETAMSSVDFVCDGVNYSIMDVNSADHLAEMQLIAAELLQNR